MKTFSGPDSGEVPVSRQSWEDNAEFPSGEYNKSESYLESDGRRIPFQKTLRVMFNPRQRANISCV